MALHMAAGLFYIINIIYLVTGDYLALEDLGIGVLVLRNLQRGTKMILENNMPVIYGSEFSSFINQTSLERLVDETEAFRTEDG